MFMFAVVLLLCCCCVIQVIFVTIECVKFHQFQCKIILVECKSSTATQIWKKTCCFFGKNYTAGTNFTRLPVAMVVTKLNSANKLCIPSQTLLVFVFLCLFAFQYVLYCIRICVSPLLFQQHALHSKSNVVGICADPPFMKKKKCLRLEIWDNFFFSNKSTFCCPDPRCLKNSKPENLNPLLTTKTFDSDHCLAFVWILGLVI